MHGYQRFSNLHATMLLAVQETPNAMTGFFFFSALNLVAELPLQLWPLVV